ncbi:MAG: glycosyltransferase [Actinomycetota bacterium]|nr:glycosyltransferase [Actinomycetota bacterium]
MPSIHQFIPTFSDGDGTSNCALSMQIRMRELGIDSELFVMEDRSKRELPYYLDYKGSNDDILIYHLATASPMPRFLGGLGNPLAVMYHNLTPPKYFAEFDPLAAQVQEHAKADLDYLASRAIAGIAPSRYNAKDLVDAAFPEVLYAPIVFNPEDFMVDGDPKVDKMLWNLSESGFSNWVFIGRLVPNKAQEKLIMTLAVHRELYGDSVYLHLVGRPSYKGYVKALVNLAKELGVQDRLNITFGVSTNALASFYSMSDLFISTSEHEGFCMPLVEAMYNRLPILAVDTSAIGETLGQGGICVDSVDPRVLAMYAHEICTLPSLAENLRDMAKLRLEEIGARATLPLLDQAIVRLLELAGVSYDVPKWTQSKLVLSS